MWRSGHRREDLCAAAELIGERITPILRNIAAGDEARACKFQHLRQWFRQLARQRRAYPQTLRFGTKIAGWMARRE